MVEAFGRSHDHENLFMSSTGVIPTAATMSSTLTAIALALRTAGHILPQAVNKTAAADDGTAMPLG